MIHRKENKMETDTEMAKMIYSLDKDAKALTIKIVQR